MITTGNSVHFDTFGRTALTEEWHFNHATPYNIICYVKSGKAAYILNGETHTFKEGHLYILSGLANITRTLIAGEVFDHMYFDFSSNKILKHDVVEIDVAKHPVLFSIAETISLFFSETKISELTFPEYRNNKELLKMVNSFFEILIGATNSVVPLFTDIDPRISKSLDYIHKNFYNNELSVEKIANHIHMSVTYFNTLFYNETKKTPYKYIMEFRLNHAYKLLGDGESVKSVANTAGYATVYSFSKAFKQHFGVSPGSIQPSNGEEK